MHKPLLATASILALTLLAACDNSAPPVAISTAPQTVPEVPSTLYKIKIGADERSYLVHTPKGKFVPPLPLVVLLHGATDSAAYALQAYRWGEKADNEGFVVVAPDALGEKHMWNAFDAAPNADVDFISAMLDEVIKREKIDDKRVYIAGHSAGGAMAYRYACDHAERIAAVGVVAGFVKRDKSADFQKPSRPMPVIAFHGQKDDNLPFDEYGVKAAKWWAGVNGCLDVPNIEPAGEGVMRWTYHNGKAAVIFYDLPSGNHMWPGGYQMPGKSQTPPTIPDATDMMWNFFSAYPKK